MGFIGMWPLNYFSEKQQFYWLRFILGLAEAGFFPGVVVYLSHWFRYDDRAKAKARFMIGIPISTVVGVPLSRLILENVEWMGLRGWRWVYILEGIPAIIFGVVTLFYLTDRPHQAKWLPDDEKAWITSELAREREQKLREGRTGIFEAFKNPQIVLLVFIYFFLVTGSYGLTFFLPSIVENLSGLSTVGRTFVTTLPYICCTLGMLYNARSSDRHRERKWHTAIPMFLMSLGLGLSVIVGDYVAFTIAALCLAGVGQASIPTFWTIPSAILTGSAAAASVGLINSVGNLGGFIGPYAVGFLKTATGSYNSGMWFLAACTLIAALLAMRLRSPRMDLPSASR